MAPGASPRTTRTRARRDQRVERRPVPVLGRAEDPEGRAESTQRGVSPRRMFLRSRARPARSSERLRADAQRGAGRPAVAGRRVAVEAVGHRSRRVDPARRASSRRGELVDRHVAPRRVVARPVEVGEVRALPGQVVVVQERGPALEHPVEGLAGARVERQRRDVLDDDEVGVARARASSPARRASRSRRGRGRGRARRRRPTRRRSTPRGRARAAPRPLGRLDRDAVGAAEAVAHDGDAGHEGQARGPKARNCPGSRVVARGGALPAVRGGPPWPSEP